MARDLIGEASIKLSDALHNNDLKGAKLLVLTAGNDNTRFDNRS